MPSGDRYEKWTAVTVDLAKASYGLSDSNKFIIIVNKYYTSYRDIKYITCDSKNRWTLYNRYRNFIHITKYFRPISGGVHTSY